MKQIILAYLLAKCALGKTLTHFDIGLATILRLRAYPFHFDENGRVVEDVPSYVQMMANLKQEAALPEAWSDFLWEKGWKR